MLFLWQIEAHLTIYCLWKVYFFVNVLNLLSDSVSVQRSLYRQRMIRDPATRALNQMWAEEREDYLGQIEALKSRESKMMEQNQELINECTNREMELVAAVEECT